MSDFLNKALFDNIGIQGFTRLTDLATLRQKLISSNIANINTHGYQKKDIDFDTELRKAIMPDKLSTTPTNARHIVLGNSRSAAPKVHSTDSSENDTGVNSIDVEQEMATMAQNQLIFDFAATMLSKKFKGLKAAIRGRT